MPGRRLGDSAATASCTYRGLHCASAGASGSGDSSSAPASSFAATFATANEKGGTNGLIALLLQDLASWQDASAEELGRIVAEAGADRGTRASMFNSILSALGADAASVGETAVATAVDLLDVMEGQDLTPDVVSICCAARCSDQTTTDGTGSLVYQQQQ